MTVILASLIKLYVAPEIAWGDIGGAFHTINAVSGLNAPRIIDAMVKLIRIAERDWRNEIFNPSNGASMALTSALPSVVSRMTSGNFAAVKSACCGSRHQPIAAP